ncbi:hypothetical protein SDC9_210415 [bioreactor metagenome]|uniref:Uncharacterized protein n=1 Tax=bioreactor metagenome TaxID=1076179 RepID=A0A645JTQ7_9ZZZZ
MGAEAVPPMFAKLATPQVNMSSLNILASASRISPWIAKIIKPAIIHSGASLSSAKLAREASSAITMYSRTFETSAEPGIWATGVTAKIKPRSVTTNTVQVALSRIGAAA